MNDNWINFFACVVFSLTPFSLPNTLHFALHNVTETVYFAKQVKFSWLVFLALFIYLLNPVEFVNNDIAVQSTSFHSHLCSFFCLCTVPKKKGVEMGLLKICNKIIKKNFYAFEITHPPRTDHWLEHSTTVKLTLAPGSPSKPGNPIGPGSPWIKNTKFKIKSHNGLARHLHAQVFLCQMEKHEKENISVAWPNSKSLSSVSCKTYHVPFGCHR